MIERETLHATSLRPMSCLHKTARKKDQPQHPDRSPLPAIEPLVINEVTRRQKATFLHHPPGGRVIHEVATDERTNRRGRTDPVNHRLQSLAANAPVPIGSPHPIPHGGLLLPSRQVAIAGGAIPHRSNHLIRLFPDDRPSRIVVEHRADNPTALLHRLMRRPSCPRSYLRIRG